MLRWGPADAERVLKDHGDWLAMPEGEEIRFAAKTIRDYLIFTNRRLVVTDTQGALWQKTTEYISVPYRSIDRWSVESKKTLLDGATLKVWLVSREEPVIDLELQRDSSARDVMEVLARHA